MRRLGLGPGAEFDLIRRFLRGPPESRRDVLVGPGDDCAVVRGSGIALTIDLSVEGVHFRRDWLSAEEVGYRVTMAAISDLAAVAARPIGVLVSLGVVPEDTGDAAVHVMAGVRAAVETVAGTVLGGDVTRSPGPMMVDIAAVGETAAPVLRSGAAPGQEVWVTGALGGAAGAVARWLEGGEPEPDLRERYARPAARVREALWLAERGVPRAMLDLSDGLLGDAGHLAAASGVAVVLERGAIPVDPGVAAAFGPGRALELAVGGGEDYELCFCAEVNAAESVREAFARELGLELTRVGVVEDGEGVYWRAADGGREKVEGGGFQHFDD